MAQHLSHLLAPNLLCCNPSSLLSPFSVSVLQLLYAYLRPSLSVYRSHIRTYNLQSVLCKCGCGYYRPRGPRASPPIHFCSLHYQLYLSICPSVHHCLHPAAHLAVLLASFSTHSRIAALLWVTFKDQAPLLINTETAALYSMSVLSFLPSFSLFQSQKCFAC